MPSLSDTLDSLKSRTEELAYLSTLNSKPSGPFVQAYLHLPNVLNGSNNGRNNVLDLIRDAGESERRLFKFIGETDGPSGTGNKRVEKREGGIVTPLKELKSTKQKNGRDEIEVVLRTAMKLVDDYRPMPRARAHIANLLDNHHSSQERLIELEELIRDASKPPQVPSPLSTVQKSASPSPPKADVAKPDEVKMTPEESIKAEEASLRALELSLIQLRKSHQNQDGGQNPPSSFASPPQSTRNLASSPPTGRYEPNTDMMQTPARPFGGSSVREMNQTPATVRQMPHVTNSLVVNGMTPRRVDRFSPLRLLTPRAPVGSSGLSQPEERRTIFGRPSTSHPLNRSLSGSASASGIAGSNSQPVVPTPGGPSTTTPFNKTLTSSTNASSHDADASSNEDETVRFPRPVPPPVLEAPIQESTPGRTDGNEHPTETPKATPDVGSKAQENNGSRLDGIDTEADEVKAGIAKVWSTLGDMMRQGIKPGQVVGEDVQSSVKHLIHLSSSDLPSPPSPSSSSVSSLSAPSGIPTKPITSETILFSHLFISLLRSASLTSEGNGGVDMNELKESLTSIAKARKFDGASGLGTKVIYAAVGKRTVKIERKGGSGRVRFAD
ncbi:uncharacterized protein IL334_005510 [Kwoniella shivajii]|uniref:Uncharacterized protein n=1 Tax=Kwoniella shivajii TaxID=564305 RepID=A0ABZ1D406_9TREE|nr:hypothetical protein IL334_005510 [Kwoniella shivajii]